MTETKQPSAAAQKLAAKKCLPCEGGVPPCSDAEVAEHLAALPEWKRSADGKRIVRRWRALDFMTAIDFFQRVATLAESQNHHPDLHLTGYRNVSIEIGTHAIDGLSENDFILAAQIDQLPLELK
ncbi:MAG: 4a-hydroxytetrahydrobiopterin dehydratase [Pirellulales bacterium]